MIFYTHVYTLIRMAFMEYHVSVQGVDERMINVRYYYTVM